MKEKSTIQHRQRTSYISTPDYTLLYYTVRKSMFERREERILVDIDNFVILVVVSRHGKKVRVVGEVKQVFHRRVSISGAGVAVVHLGPVITV